MNRLAALRGRGNDDRIDATAARELLSRCDRILTGFQINGLRTETASQFEPAPIHINAEYATAVGSEQLHRDLTDQAKAGHVRSTRRGSVAPTGSLATRWRR
jgi:hypothetical protein